MLSLLRAGHSDAPPTVLCVGAHADDLEIGCGGTVLALARQVPGVRFHWLVLSAAGERRAEAAASARAFLAEAPGSVVALESFRDGFLPWEGAAVKERFEALKAQVEPDLVFTHHRGDAHQDHRLAGELTWNTFRRAPILEYEIPKWDGDLGRPNVYLPLDRDTAERKLALLLEHFGSQRSRDWFSEDTFRGLLRLRGVECRAPDGLAEAFHGPKLVLGPAGPRGAGGAR